MTSSLRILSIFVVFVGICVYVFFLIFLPTHNIILTSEGETPDMSLTGNVGDFVGGTIGTIFTLASALLVIVTLREQENQNARDRFAQSFYEMLHLHRENVSEMSLSKGKGITLNGRMVFSELIKEYTQVYKLIDSYCENILSCSKCESVKNYLNVKEKRLLLEMKLTYGYFFYGSDDYTLDQASNDEDRIQVELKRLLDYNNYTISSHNVLLGHYFRHLFQMVKMLEDEGSLKDFDRYNYAKQLRAQLNDDEQLLLHYNAMSEIGAEWYKPYRRSTRERKPMSLIERYQLIKNIPSNMEVLGVKTELLKMQRRVPVEGIILHIIRKYIKTLFP